STDSSAVTTAVDLGFVYDANANVTQIVDYPTGRQTRAMHYDAVGRLVDVTSPMFGVATYDYNTVDNLMSLTVTGGDQSRTYGYVYDAENRLGNLTNGIGGPTIQGFGYDEQGNLKNKSGAIYQFDFGNRLRSAPQEVGYVYDGHGRRVSVASGFMNPRFRHSFYSQNGRLLYGENSGSSSRTETIYLGESVVAVRSLITNIPNGQPTTTFYHTDALGTPIAYSGISGSVTRTAEYEAYGQLINSLPFDGIGFAGHVQDPATGLTYMQQRYYDPGVGRFLSVDPVTADPATGINFNRYAYANSNPYKFFDPDGRAATVANGTIYIRPEDPAMPAVSFQNNVGATGVGPDRMFFHDYIISTPSKSNDPGAVALELARNPTPGIQDYSTPSGTLNNVGHLPMQLDFGVNMVRSFTIPSPDSSKYTDVIVNYTVSGSHVLEEGFVMQFGQILPSGQISLVTYGEGNAFVQGNWNKELWGPMLREVWETVHEQVNEDLTSTGE
ncbi:MAG: RHS repeat-associated core domain-containing protein, partial [Pseudoxanthomonas sp.]